MYIYIYIYISLLMKSKKIKKMLGFFSYKCCTLFDACKICNYYLKKQLTKTHEIS